MELPQTSPPEFDLDIAIDPLKGTSNADTGVDGPVARPAGSGALAAPPRAEASGHGPLPKQVRVAVVGAGFGGIDAAIQLMNAGETDVLVLERAEGPAGCWRANSYPGVACDVPSNLYSFSFAPNPNWTRTYSPGGEIARYIESVARRFGVMQRIRFGVSVERAQWIDEDQQWEIQTDAGTLRAQFVIGATGPLTEPVFPAVAGRESFTGIQMHSARWDHDVDLAGKRVAVIGTGASAIQFVPELAKTVARLDVYQRTAPWVLPRTDRSTTRFERALYRTLPVTQRLSRKAIYWSREILVAGMRGNRLVRGALQVLGTAQLRRQVQDPQLRAKLTPKFAIGCKRILLSNTWYPTLTKPNVELITDSITEIRPTGVVTADGVLHEVDAIVYGTGFHVTDPPTADAIFNGKGETLAEHWRGSPKCYLGTAIDGYPNLFMLVGPNSGVGHTSILLSIEWQVHYATQAIAAATEHGISSYSLRPEVMDEWVADVDRMSQGTVWLNGGCSSYYIDASGRNSSTWPTYTWKLRDRLEDFDPESYVVRREVAAPARASA